MNLYSLFVLILIYLIMFTCNVLMPICYGDDYLYSYIWTEQTRFFQPLPDGAERVSSLYDILISQWNHYFTWGGRTIAHLLAQFFLWQGKFLFDLINPLVVILLIMEIYWISNKGIVSLNFKTSRLCYIFSILWLLTPGFGSIYLWLTGSCNYLWTTVLLLAFILPYIRKYYNIKTPSLLRGGGIMFCSGIIAGWTNENTVCWFIIAIAIMIYKNRKNHTLERWMVAGLVGLCIGYALLMFAPGNMERMAFTISAEEFEKDTNQRLFNAGFTLMMIIMIGQVLLWYFFFGTIRKQKDFGNSENVQRSLFIAKVFALITILSNLIMLLSPSFFARSMFPGFIYLLIAVTTSIRMQHEIGKNQLEESARKFLHVAVTVAFSINLCITIMGISAFRQNDINIQRKVDQLRLSQSEEILELPGFHYPEWIDNFGVLHLPIFSVDDRPSFWVNDVYAHYNGIKGIKFIKSKDD